MIHNGRFSLPAGTYGIDVTFGDQVPAQPTPLSLQVGRVGPPLQTWTLQPQAGENWQTSLWLALDAGFVGFRGPLEMERAIDLDHHHAHGVVDAGARPHLREVLSAASYQDVDVLSQRADVSGAKRLLDHWRRTRRGHGGGAARAHRAGRAADPQRGAG